MESQASTKSILAYRSAGLNAIVSGILGAFAFGFLVTYLIVRDKNFAESIYFLRCHDAGVILQFLFLIPVLKGLYMLLKKQLFNVTQTALYIGIGSILLTVLFVFLAFPKIMTDVLYLFPQGIFGVWIIYFNWHMRGILSKGLRWFGIIVGLGLTLAGIFPVGYAIFVDTIILQIPAASDEAVQRIPTDTTANVILHQMVAVGTLLGVVTLPIWTILLGRKLSRLNI
jgi:hypothetical protein